MARVYVYGSCVSRDSFEFLDKSQHQLLGYTARQSLISATSSPYLAEAQAGTLESRFQIRNLQGDFDGSIFGTLLDVADQADYIFWDLTDERLGVIKVSDAAYITRSVELIQSGLIGGIDEADWIKFGSDRHFALWQEAVRKFAKFSDTHSVQSKLVLFNIPWSMSDDTGAPLPRAWDMFPDEANNHLARYVAAVREHMEVNYIELPWEMARSSATHKWGLAPYHYLDRVYEAIAERFTALEAASSFTGRTGTLLEPESNSKIEWHDSVTEPVTRALPPGTSAFGLQIQARNRTSPARLIISLKLEGAEGLHLFKQRVTKSIIPGIGHFRYLDIDSGERSYFAGFSLPAGVTCQSVTVKGWQLGKGQVDIGPMTVFPTSYSPDGDESDSARLEFL